MEQEITSMYQVQYIYFFYPIGDCSRVLFFVSTNYGGMQSTYILMSLPFASATTEAFAFVGNLNPNHYY